MTNSNVKIAAGVAAYDGPAGPALAKFAKGPKNLTALTEVAAKSSLAFDRFRKVIALRKTEIAKRSSEIRLEWAEHTDLARNVREAMAENEIATYRHNILKNTEQDRYSLISELRGFESEVSAIAPLYESAAHLLAREGLGTEERSRYLAQMAHSGPAEVANFARLAASTGNRVLGAAVLSKLDSMSADNRKLCAITRQELAEVLVGPDYERARESIRIASNRMQEAVNLNRSFEAGRPIGGLSGIALGLAKHGETGVLNDDEGEK